MPVNKTHDWFPWSESTMKKLCSARHKLLLSTSSSFLLFPEEECQQRKRSMQKTSNSAWSGQSSFWLRKNATTDSFREIKAKLLFLAAKFPCLKSKTRNNFLPILSPASSTCNRGTNYPIVTLNFTCKLEYPTVYVIIQCFLCMSILPI